MWAVARAAYSSADKIQRTVIRGRSGDWSAMAAYTRRDYQNWIIRVSSVHRRGADAPNPQDGRSDAALARLVYDPANGQAADRRYLTHLYTNGSPVAAHRSTVSEADSGHRKRVSLDWSWEGEGRSICARRAHWQMARTGNIPRKTAPCQIAPG